MSNSIYLRQFKVYEGTANSGLASLGSLSGIGYKDNKYWWNEVESYGTTGVTFNICSTPSIGGSTTTEEIYDQELCPAGTLPITVGSSGIYTDDTYIMAFVSFRTGTGALPPSYIFKTYLAIRYSDDNGSTWSDITYEIATGSGVIQSLFSFRPYRIGSNYYITLAHLNSTTGVHTYHALQILSSVSLIDSYTIDNIQSFYLGCVDNEKYYTITEISSALHLFSFDGTTIVDEETLTASLPSAYIISRQSYHRFKTKEIINNPYSLQYRLLDDENWIEIDDTDISANAVMWDYDKNYRYIAKYIFWKQSVFKIFGSGNIVKIQDLTGVSGFVGWGSNVNEVWFSTSLPDIYYYTYTQTVNSTTYSIFRGDINFNNGELILLDATTSNIWSSDLFLNIDLVYNSTTYDIFSGFVIDNNFTDVRTIVCESAWIRDMAMKVTTSFIGQTAYTILSNVTTGYCNYCTSDVTTSGTTTYNITFNNQTIEEIYKTMCHFENWVNYITPDLIIKANDGTVDSGDDILVDLTTTNDAVYNVSHKTSIQQVGIIELWGGLVGGKRLKTTYKTSVFNTLTYFDNYPSITITEDLKSLAQQIGDSKDTGIFQVRFSVADKPPLQWGEQITFLYKPWEHIKSELGTGAQYFLNQAAYDLISFTGTYNISDVRIMERGSGDNQDGVTSSKDQQLIDQLAGS